jgi:hypothetical protein
VDENARSTIRLAIYGGTGGDVYTIRGSLKNTIYEQEAEQNKIQKGAGTRIKKDKRKVEAAK